MGSGRSGETTPTANGMLRHLIGAANAIRAEIGTEIEGLGHEYAPAASHLIVNLPAEGLGMSELADRLRLTPQRTGQLVQNLESFGYVERIPEPEDGRARRVVFTDRGRALLADIDRIDERFTRLLAERLGPARFARLCEDAEFLDRAFRDDDELIDLRR
ncbi:MAG: MarR family transcriptional regulator [Myxococcota bacterium]